MTQEKRDERLNEARSAWFRASNLVGHLLAQRRELVVEMLDSGYCDTKQMGSLVLIQSAIAAARAAEQDERQLTTDIGAAEGACSPPPLP